MRRFVLFFLSLALCFCSVAGCQKQPEQIETEPFQTTDEAKAVEKDTQPEMLSADPTGTLQTSKLEILPWDSGRANESSGNNLWEVENGYYFLWSQVLYYADKSNIGLWVPVCAKPDCEHDPISNNFNECDAVVPWNLLMKEDRFYFNGQYDDIDDFIQENLYSHYIASMALDGSDKRLEYYVPEAENAMKTSDGNARRPYLLDNCFIYSVATLNQEGLYDTVVYFVDDNGTDILLEDTRETNNVSGALSRQHCLYGDEGIFTSVFGGSYRTLYRVKDRQLYGVDLINLPWNGGYLEGDTLLGFRNGEGYYYIDLNTSEETKLADAQFERGVAYIMKPNCILESMIFRPHDLSYSEFKEYRQSLAVDEFSLRFFDGEQWFEVALPEEVAEAGEMEYLRPMALTSDRIFLYFHDAEDRGFDEPIALYQILLGTDTPTLEYLGTIG